MDLDREWLIRQHVFRWLEDRGARDQRIRRTELEAGVTVAGVRIPLISQRGIWKPKVTSLPLSIMTSPKDPYGDRITDEGFLHYRYYGTDPLHRDNVGLRRLSELGMPLVYLHGLEPGWYQAAWPAVIHHDDPGTLTFTVALEDPTAIRPDLSADDVEEVSRAYTSSLALRRLHQAKFRTMVLSAYAETCAVCRLRGLPDLLDAAHIRADAAGGAVRVSNGLALCKIHHAAFDRHVVGIRPDYVVEINQRVLDAVDGPMLRHGLQERHGERIHHPAALAKRPDPELLEERYEAFRQAG